MAQKASNETRSSCVAEYEMHSPNPTKQSKLNSTINKWKQLGSRFGIVLTRRKCAKFDSFDYDSAIRGANFKRMTNVLFMRVNRLQKKHHFQDYSPVDTSYFIVSLRTFLLVARFVWGLLRECIKSSVENGGSRSTTVIKPNTNSRVSMTNGIEIECWLNDVVIDKLQYIGVSSFHRI